MQPPAATYERALPGLESPEPVTIRPAIGFSAGLRSAGVFSGRSHKDARMRRSGISSASARREIAMPT